LQGLVGWIMVASGLTDDAIYVKPTRLALHFVFALVLFFYTFWFALKLLVREEQRVHDPGLRNFTWAIIGLLFVQFAFGALMAGHRAAPAAPTWPDINGTFVPESLANGGGLRAYIENPIAIHFAHRSLAYLLVVLVLAWTVMAFRLRSSRAFGSARLLPLITVLVQLGLGIATVLTSIHIRATKWNDFEWMAQLHQFVALLLLLSLVYPLYLLTVKKTVIPDRRLDPQRI
ncbi:MAG TPA: COX15/CtaA family protein, partial [Chitinophagaceae bacterium]|nr:COX15/CtaA family protein [Chitinophagaceae bacterium]